MVDAGVVDGVVVVVAAAAAYDDAGDGEYTV